VDKKIENNEKEKKQEYPHAGHRQRLLKKLSQDVLLEHELLETLLFYSIPRRNTNDIAHRLLAEFRSVRGIFDASIERLMQVEGVGLSTAQMLYCFGRLYKRGIEQPFRCLPAVFKSDSFVKYVKEQYEKEEVEVLDFYLLDKDSKIVSVERFSQSDFFGVNIEPKAFTQMLLKGEPTGFVVVHNHPVGSCAPSDADTRTTMQFQIVASFHNILFCDHFIYGKDGVYSYYLDGKMKEISEKFSIGNLTGENK
jgi:DNA repair protein RadC